MKTITQTLILFTMVTGLVLLTNASLKAQTDTKNTTTISKSDNEKTLKVEVKGMSCQKGCADGLDRTFKETAGIIKSRTSYDNSSSEITYDAAKISDKEIIKIIKNRGFKVNKL